MDRILKGFVTLAIFVGSVGWIVFSYLPETVLRIPQYRFMSEGFTTTTLALLIASLVVILVLQVWVVAATGRSAQQFNRSEEAARVPFDLDVRKEIVLTALPILFTILLGAVTYQWWQQVLLLP